MARKIAIWPPCLCHNLNDLHPTLINYFLGYLALLESTRLHACRPSTHTFINYFLGPFTLCSILHCIFLYLKLTDIHLTLINYYLGYLALLESTRLHTCQPSAHTFINIRSLVVNIPIKISQSLFEINFYIQSNSVITNSVITNSRL
jgi:hypothetical protein